MAPFEIIEARKKLGLNQYQFADRMDVCRATVQSWERGSKRIDGAREELLKAISGHPDGISFLKYQCSLWGVL